MRESRISNTADVCRKFKINRRTLFRWKKKWSEDHNLSDKVLLGSRPKLTANETEQLLDLFRTNPGTTNDQAAVFLNHKIKPQSVSNYLKRAGFTRKEFTDEQENYGNQESIQEIKNYYSLLQEIPEPKRVYMDESFIYDYETPRFGRSLKGERIPRSRSRHGRKWTVYLAIREDGLVHPPILSDESANDLNFYHYVWQHLAPNLRRGDVVIWDRLGKAGRCANPSKQHYNPDVKRLIEEKGCQVMFLPPKGKYFNPIELVFGILKTHLRNRYTVSAACLERRTRTEEELKIDLDYATTQITALKLEGCFRERANDGAFKKYYPDILLEGKKNIIFDFNLEKKQIQTMQLR